MARSHRPTVAVFDREPGMPALVAAALASSDIAVREIASTQDLLTDAEDPPEVAVLIDAADPASDPLGLPAVLAERPVPVPVIAAVPPGDVERAVAAMKAGAVDVLEKPLDPARLADAVARARAIQDRWVRNFRERTTARERLTALTPRERQVWELLGKGNPNWQIAQELGVTPQTLDIYRMKVKDKLGTATTAQIARYFLLVNTAPLGLAYVAL